MAILQSEPDRYGGIVVDGACLPCDPASFANDLAASLDVWRDEGARVVWLLPLIATVLVIFAKRARRFDAESEAPR